MTCRQLRSVQLSITVISKKLLHISLSVFFSTRCRHNRYSLRCTSRDSAVLVHKQQFYLIPLRMAQFQVRYPSVLASAALLFLLAAAPVWGVTQKPASPVQSAPVTQPSAVVPLPPTQANGPPQPTQPAQPAALGQRAVPPQVQATQLPKQSAQDPKCLMPLETGPCRMSLERFYYNSQTNTCQPFKFGGCRGNDNKFGFLKTCEDACVRSRSGVAVAGGGSAAGAATSGSGGAAAGAVSTGGGAAGAAATGGGKGGAAVVTAPKAGIK